MTRARTRGADGPLLILQCEVLADSLPEAAAMIGEMDELFRHTLAYGDQPVVASRVCRGDTPPPPDDLMGVVITGSGAMVSDGEPWIMNTAAWLRKAYATGVPLLGVCFGHQLLAHALGGRVAPMPEGPKYATTTARLTDEARKDLLFHSLPRQFPVQSAHYQAVTVPPAGAVVLAEGARGIQALRLGPAAWGVQFHPEFNARILGVLIQTLRSRLAGEGCDVDASLHALRETPHARGVLPRFHAFASARRHLIERNPGS